jgi:hypothetical protein
MAGYTRQDTTGQLANGNPIDADLFNDEYDAIEGAFNASTGHTHDGSVGGGAPIESIGPSQELEVTSNSVFPKLDNLIDNGKTTLRWRNGYYGTDLQVGQDVTVIRDASIGRNLTVTGNATINGNTTIGNAASDTVTVTADVASNLIPSASGTYNLGTSTDEWNNLFLDGTAKVDFLTVDEDATVTGDLAVTGATGIDGNFDINTNKFTVNATSGNTTIGGTLGVTGQITGNVTGNLTGNVTGNVTGDVTGNADTATAWQTSRTLSLTGDVTGSVSGVDGTGNISIATTIQPNSVALGTDTTGNYVASLVAGTGVTLTNNTGEGATPTVAIGQAVGTTSNVTFNDVVVSGNLTVSGSTTTVNTETINLADNQIVLNSNYTGSSPTENGGIEIERGTLANKTLVWDETADKWTVGSETFVAGIFEGALTGNVTGNINGIIGGTTPAAVTGTTIQFNTGLTDGTTTITGFADEDDMVSNSAALIPTQQSVKAYVDAAVAGDGSGNIEVDTANVTTLDLGGGTGWTITQNGTTLEFKYNGAVQAKLTSTGTFQVNDDVEAEAF